jgi:hypothetical protein
MCGGVTRTANEATLAEGQLRSVSKIPQESATLSGGGDFDFVHSPRHVPLLSRCGPLRSAHSASDGIAERVEALRGLEEEQRHG